MTNSNTNINRGNITILNVDDSEANRYIKSRLLRSADYRLIDAATGRDTLLLTRLHHPHLVVLDVHLPDMDGLEVCRAIKDDPETKSTMVLLVSASRVAMTDKIIGLEKGADGYLIEPIEPEEFLATIAALLRLYHSEQRLALALKATNDVVWDWDAVRNCLVWSQAGADRFGWSEIVEQPQPAGWWRERVHPDDQVRVAERLAATLRDPSVTNWNDEYRFQQADSRYAWVIDRAYVVRDAHGTVTRMVGAMQDVTVTRSALRALSDSENRLTMAMATGLMGSWEWDVLTGKVQWSPGHFSLLGLQPNEVHPSYESWAAHVHPDDLPRVEAILRDTMQAHTEYVADYRVIWPDGSIHWVAGQGRYEYDSDGRCTRMIGIMTDITERKQSEQALQETEARLRLAIESAAIGTWDLNLVTGHHQWDRRCKVMFGLPPDADVSHEDFLALIHPDDRARVISTFERAMDPTGDSSYDIECRITPTNCSDSWIRVMGRVLFEERDGHRQANRFIGTVLDITSSKQAQEQLQRWGSELQQAVALKTTELMRSQERLRALAADLNLTEQRERKRLATDLHDYLAQLLVVMRMKLRQAVPLLRTDKPATLLKDADQALTQALDYTRTLVAELAPPTLNEFGLLQSVDWLASQMRLHGLRVEVQTAVDTLSLPEDQAILLFQSVRELLYNVLKHAHTDKATVSLALTSTNDLQITVEDRGCGMEVSTLEQQSDSPSRFGLFSLKERMASMGGRVSLSSEVGRGTRVDLYLPYWPVQPLRRVEPSLSNAGCENQPLGDKPTPSTRQSGPASQASALRGTPRTRVLLVDDHAMVRQGLRSVLESYPDIEVVGEAADGNEALALVEQLRPSVVVMDLNMPNLNGIDATAIIKSRHPEIVILGLSVNAGEDNQAAMSEAGAAGLLTKEAAVDELYDTINEAIAAQP